MTRIAIPNMTCGHCRAKIEDAVLDADEGARLTFDMDARQVEVDSVLDAAALISTIASSGYEAHSIG